MAPRDRVGRVLESKASASEGILRRLLSLLMRKADRLEWSSESAVKSFNVDAAELIRQAQRQAGRVSAQAARHVMDEVDSSPIPPGDDSVSIAVQTRPDEIADLTEPIRQKIVDADAEDDDEAVRLFGEALDRLERDLERVADDAITEADRDVQAKVYERASNARSERLVYRRVVHPEKSRGGSCGLCVAASTRVYTRADLKPIHSRCHCDVVPLTSHEDLGEALNKFDLGDLYDKAASTGAHAMKRVRVSESGAITSTVKDPAGSGSKSSRTPSQPTPKRSGEWQMTPKWARHQLELMKPLPDTPWKRKQSARLRKFLDEAA